MAYPDFLDDASGQDYDGIRALLGVTTLDVEDELIELPPFGPQAEFFVQRRVETWATIIQDPPDGIGEVALYVLRLASSYRTACLMAETWATGGTVGNVHPPDASRNWPAIAAGLCGKAEEWIAVAIGLEDPETPTNVEYDLPLMVVSGPTRAAFRHHGVPRPRWWRYPPVVGVPPDWASDIYNEPWLG